MTPQQLTTFYTTTINNWTLAKALEEHYKINPQFTRYDQFETFEAGQTIKSHDISHLIYGCDTSYLGEYQVQMWNNNGSKKTMPKFSFKMIFSKDLKSLIQLVIPTGLIEFARENKTEMDKVKAEIKTRSTRMTKKWIYGEEGKYMYKKIAEIRGEFGIEILR
jgi:ubiquinone biosynthesis protein Coq4